MVTANRTYLANKALTLRRRQRRSILNKPYERRGFGEIFLASSEGIVDMTSNANQVLAYLQAICFGLSIIRYVVLSRYATKKVSTISMAKNPFTTLSAIDSGPSGFLRKPNSKGDTHAV